VLEFVLFVIVCSGGFVPGQLGQACEGSSPDRGAKNRNENREHGEEIDEGFDAKEDYLPMSRQACIVCRNDIAAAQ